MNTTHGQHFQSIYHNTVHNHIFFTADVFADNLRELLLTLPCRNSVVMGLDPGFKHGCKVAVIDQKGSVLETGVIYPRMQGKLRDIATFGNTVECQTNGT